MYNLHDVLLCWFFYKSPWLPQRCLVFAVAAACANCELGWTDPKLFCVQLFLSTLIFYTFHTTCLHAHNYLGDALFWFTDDPDGVGVRIFAYTADVAIPFSYLALIDLKLYCLFVLAVALLFKGLSIVR